MRLERTRLLACASRAVLVVSCAPSAQTDSTSPGNARAPSAAPQAEVQTGQKRITIAVTQEPPALHYNPIPSPIRATPGSIQEIVHPGLTVFDHTGALRPLLAEAAPTVENGLWQLLPDGRMETRWTLKDRATWHDGTPVTSADLDFTVTHLTDNLPLLPMFFDATPTLVHNRLKNVQPLSGHEDARQAWSSYEWDVE